MNATVGWFMLIALILAPVLSTTISPCDGSSLSKQGKRLRIDITNARRAENKFFMVFPLFTQNQNNYIVKTICSQQILPYVPLTFI